MTLHLVEDLNEMNAELDILWRLAYSQAIAGQSLLHARWHLRTERDKLRMQIARACAPWFEAQS